MSRLLVLIGLLVWAGSALLLSQWSRLRRPSLAERLRPFHPGAATAGARVPRAGSPLSLAELLGPLVRDLGDGLARAFGVADGAACRLSRIHSSTPAVSFRLHQVVVAAATAVVGAVISVAAAAPAPVAILLVIGAPVLAFLIVEQRLTSRSDQWKRLTAEELPVVAEQLAMLLNAGYSVGASIGRLASRGNGCVARDLSGVNNRVQQGLSESAALREWAERVDVESVHRLVSVLALHTGAADLGRWSQPRPAPLVGTSSGAPSRRSSGGLNRSGSRLPWPR